ncbi:MAG: hypothetical protein ABEJ40_04940 [Haloarculaceae archaeon]
MRAASHQIDRAVEGTTLLDNTVEYVRDAGEGALRTFTGENTAASLVAHAGRDAKETYRDLAVPRKEALGETLVAAGEQGWLDGPEIQSVLEVVADGRVESRTVVAAGDRVAALDSEVSATVMWSLVLQERMSESTEGEGRPAKKALRTVTPPYRGRPNAEMDAVGWSVLVGLVVLLLPLLPVIVLVWLIAKVLEVTRRQVA